jgi:hypothetical protein
MTRYLLLGWLLLSWPPLALASGARVPFTVAFQGVETDLHTITTTVMPGEVLFIDTVAAEAAGPAGLQRRDGGWAWRAPDIPGLYPLAFNSDGERLQLQVLVLTPFRHGQDDSLHGFRIGEYLPDNPRGLPSYDPPGGFFNLATSQPELRVSPSFTLGQFASKQQPDHDPAFLLVRPALLIKLEALLEAARARGWAASTLHVMSGFRTPVYNAAIGNRTRASRHLYGGAADVWIDGDGDGRMDDLNGDGVVDDRDARALAALAESLASAGGRDWPPGGLAVYPANPFHGPFLHIDARGYRARW